MPPRNVSPDQIWRLFSRAPTIASITSPVECLKKKKLSTSLSKYLYFLCTSNQIIIIYSQEQCAKAAWVVYVHPFLPITTDYPCWSWSNIYRVQIIRCQTRTYFLCFSKSFIAWPLKVCLASFHTMISFELSTPGTLPFFQSFSLLFLPFP
jgi:hypothetical protein